MTPPPEILDVRTLGVVGAGLMGTGIAEAAVTAGIPTVLVKATEGGGGPAAARARIAKSLARRVERGQLSQAQVDQALDLLTVTIDRDQLRAADLVIESIVEDLAEKRALFADLGTRLHERTLLASNTSTLRLAEINQTCTDGRLVGMHFFSPVPAMNLVELAHLPATSPEVLEACRRFIERLGKTAVPVVDSCGFVVNRLLVPYLVGAIAAFGQGLAGAGDIDTAMKLGLNHPLGPLALSDLIGLDVVFAMAKLLFKEFGDDRYRPPAILRRLVQDGNLGKKTGLGFYDYRVRPPVANAELARLVAGGHGRDLDDPEMVSAA